MYVHARCASLLRLTRTLASVLDSKAIACGASDTPFGKVAAPGGSFFASQGAGKQTSVNPGQSIQLVVSGNPGEGWPHPKGHIMTYLAQCDDDCSTFDATQGKFFKIQEEKDGRSCYMISPDSENLTVECDNVLVKCKPYSWLCQEVKYICMNTSYQQHQ